MKFKKSDTKSKVKKTFRNFMYEEKIVEELEEIKDKPAIGFIEIRENADTMVFEIP